jgi:hypothetical protein
MGEGWRKHGVMRHGGMMGSAAMRLSSYLQSDGRRQRWHARSTRPQIHLVQNRRYVLIVWGRLRLTECRRVRGCGTIGPPGT